MKLAQIYEKAGMSAEAYRVATCATWLQYLVGPDGKKQLHRGNFCQLRLCPMCIGRRAKRAVYKLSQVMNLVQAEHGVVYLFLTLTVRNCTGDELEATISQLTAAWRRLIDHRRVERSVKGWYRAIEITRNKKDGSYHPHIHAILAVEPAYFDREASLYIDHDEWVSRWQKALRVDYEPSVSISRTRGKDGSTDEAAMKSAVLEAAKYACKDKDYIDPRLSMKKAAEIVKDYTNGLRRKRLTAFGGWLKEAAVRLDAEDLENGDLVHVEDDVIREDVAELIEEYRWNFGAGDYILARQYVNPLRVVPVVPDGEAGV